MFKKLLSNDNFTIFNGDDEFGRITVVTGCDVLCYLKLIFISVNFGHLTFDKCIL